METSLDASLVIGLSLSPTLVNNNENICWMDVLPIEILKIIFQFLPGADKLRCESVCKKWLNIFLSFWNDCTRFRFASSLSSVATISNADKVISYAFDSCYENSEILLKYCVSHGGANFTHVEINDFTFNDKKSFTNFIESCSKLQSLKLVDVNFNFSTGNLFEILFTMQNLKYLFIAKCRNDNSLLEAKKSISIPSNITDIQLKRSQMKSDNFIFLCESCGPTVENFCFKQIDVNIDSFVEGLKLLSNVKNLNLENHQHFGHCLQLFDSTLHDLADRLKRVEILSLRGSGGITSVGVNYLLKSNFGLKNLQYLNLDRCPLIDDLIYDGLKYRPADSPFLLISAFETKVTGDFFNHWSKTCKWNVVIDIECKGDIFFGGVETVYYDSDDDYAEECEDDLSSNYSDDHL